jgi:hypothetical protein
MFNIENCERLIHDLIGEHNSKMVTIAGQCLT